MSLTVSAISMIFEKKYHQHTFAIYKTKYQENITITTISYIMSYKNIS